ncbi:MAG: hypothetical protein WCP21_20150, partial [Armatimonadota bacterium]
MSSPSDVALIIVTAEDDEIFVSARAAGEDRTWRWPGGGRQQTTARMKEVLQFVGERPLVCYRSRLLASLLSKPEVLPHARQQLSNLTDLCEV